MSDQFIWVEQHRPQTIADTILPARIKDRFHGFVAQKDVPNLLLTGPQGVGKTTAARALIKEIGGEYIIINGSMNGNIDTLRNQIRQYASSVSMTGGRKYVILDEADYLNATSTQPALRNFMEEYSSNCGFILTCNYKNRIIKELHSRCSVVDFTLTNEEKRDLAQKFMHRAKDILEQHNVEYDPKAVAVVVKRHSPDWRRVLNELQQASANGKLELDSVNGVDTKSLKELITALKEKRFSDIRIWVGQNTDMDTAALYRFLYDNCTKLMDPVSAAQMVLTIGKYQYQEAFVADKEINTMCCLTEIMVEADWK